MTEERTFDAIIVGSGATGGWAAKELSERGLYVLVLEAGGEIQPNNPLTIGSDDKETDNSIIQSKCFVYNERTAHLFVDDTKSPYATPSDKPFAWIRAQVVGGKSLLWMGQSYRMSDFDFKAASFDHFGEDWPISYSDLETYYTKAETFMGVTGTVEGIPQLPDGDFRPTQPLTKIENHLRASFQKYGQLLIPARLAIKQEQQESLGYCVHCGLSSQNCISYTTSIPALRAAHRTGRLALRTHAIVRHILSDESGKATGVYAIDTESGAGFEVKGRMIFLCASALESTRIMLNSLSPYHPAGIANSSCTLGHHLMDHVFGVGLTGYLSVQDRDTAAIYQQNRCLYVPRWQNLGRQTNTSFLRGYAYQIYIIRADRVFDERMSICGNSLETSQKELTANETMDDRIMVTIQGFGEMLPRYENYVEINKEGQVDAWGVPILDIHCNHSTNEIAMARDMLINCIHVFKSAGVEVIDVAKRPAMPGLCIHECGTCRMGNDPKTSVLNKYNQCHDVPNLFVTDGSSFTSQGTQNPTLTMIALTIRACEYAVEHFRSGRI